MSRLRDWLYTGRSVEEVIFTLILIAGIPYFLINEIIDLMTNQNVVVLTINATILIAIFYLLYLSIKRAIRSAHILGFSIFLGICFAFFWPASTGLGGAGAYVLQCMIVILILMNSGKVKLIFAGFGLVMVIYAGLADIEYTGKIIYTSQLTSFTLNLLVIALVMNILKIALDREQNRLVTRIRKIDLINQEIKEKNDALAQKQQEIKMIQNDLNTIIEDRTHDIEKENERLVEYAFINAHLVRAPLANMLALGRLIESEDPQIQKLRDKTKKLDETVRQIGGILSYETKKKP